MAKMIQLKDKDGTAAYPRTLASGVYLDETDTLPSALFPLSGKRVIFLGDSIAARGNSEAGTWYNPQYSWPDVFRELLHIPAENALNLAVGGATLRERESGAAYTSLSYSELTASANQNTVGHQVWRLQQEYSSFAADIILIAAGTNDGTGTWKSSGTDDAVIEASFLAQTGETGSDGYPVWDVVALDSVDRLQWPGAMRWICENLRTLYPNAAVFFCSPTQAKYTDGYRSYSDNRAKAEFMERICARLSCGYIDTRLCGVYSAAGDTISDNVHLSVKGAKLAGAYNVGAVKAYLGV